ncbi:MAG: E2 ligase fold family C protein [Bacteroidota bacterium]
MALAEYFSKDLLAISQALKKGSVQEFESTLNKTVIGIAFDNEIEKREGKAAIELTVRLLSRLYPKINFIYSGDLKGSGDELIKLSKAINSKIEITDEKPSLILSIGGTQLPETFTDISTFYIGSDRWVSKFSTKKPVGSGNSDVPLAAGAAACIGASNIFRHVFKDFLSDVEFDNDFSLSLISLSLGEENSDELSEMDLGDFILVGFGAIGNGAIWALANAPSLKGQLTIVEPEILELSNLQRYVLAEERHKEQLKIEIPKEYIKNPNIKLNVIQNTWAEFANGNSDWKNSFVLISIDNAKDRVGVQSSLPRKIINSYTGDNLIGISRHLNFGEEACVVCTYMPTGQAKSFALQVAENLGIHNVKLPPNVLPNITMEFIIGGYLHSNKGADDQLLQWIADENSIDRAELEQFKDIPVRDFYSRFVCGGVLMEMKKNGNKVGTVEAPLAFQSALAGILLISEFMLEKADARKNNVSNVTQVFPLAPIKNEMNPRNTFFEKDGTGRCICSDSAFIKAYKKKYSIGSKIKVAS